MNEQIKDGGAAFPVPDMGIHGAYGMSLRDYFAAKTMEGYCANISRTPTTTTELAESAYMLADAMLAAREAKS